MKKVQLLAWFLIFSVIAFCAAGQEEGEERSEALARELLEVTGAGQMGIQVMQQMSASFKNLMPDVPQEFWDRFFAEVDPDDMTDLVVPIYVKHLTEEEMAAAVAFYKTPAGRAITTKLPVIMQESIMAGQQWGMQLGAEVQKRLQEQEE